MWQPGAATAWRLDPEGDMGTRDPLVVTALEWTAEGKSRNGKYAKPSAKPKASRA